MAKLRCSRLRSLFRSRAFFSSAASCGDHQNHDYREQGSVDILPCAPCVRSCAPCQALGTESACLLHPEIREIPGTWHALNRTTAAQDWWCQNGSFAHSSNTGVPASNFHATSTDQRRRKISQAHAVASTQHNAWVSRRAAQKLLYKSNTLHAECTHATHLDRRGSEVAGRDCDHWRNRTIACAKDGALLSERRVDQ